MNAVCEALGVARSNIAAGLRSPIAKPLKRVGRPPAPEEGLVARIEAIIGDQPTYGYRRVWALLKREGREKGLAPVNAKRVHRVMKAHAMLLQRHAGGADERRHDGKIAVERSNLRWCSDGFELACDNGEKVRVAFALDCCDREAMAWVATTQGIKGGDVRDLMTASVESRFGPINRLPRTIEWLSDNGSGYIAKETRAFARDLGFEPLTTPVTSPQSNGMAEAFVRTIKRDYARVDLLPDARTVFESLPLWFDHYNAVHPHSALRYLSPREFIAAQSNQGGHVRSLRGNNICMGGRSRYTGRPFLIGAMRSRMSRAALMLPRFAASNTTLTISLASSCISFSASTVVLLRVPGGFPLGLPDWPF